jgi:hypothetical protein
MEIRGEKRRKSKTIGQTECLTSILKQSALPPFPPTPGRLWRFQNKQTSRHADAVSRLLDRRVAFSRVAGGEGNAEERRGDMEAKHEQTSNTSSSPVAFFPPKWWSRIKIHTLGPLTCQASRPDPHAGGCRRRSCSARPAPAVEPQAWGTAPSQAGGAHSRAHQEGGGPPSSKGREGRRCQARLMRPRKKLHQSGAMLHERVPPSPCGYLRLQPRFPKTAPCYILIRNL